MPAQRRTGAYAKLLANYAEDDAIIEAGEKAELLFIRGLAFCADSDSDGFITDKQLTRVVGAGMRDANARARKLVSVGLWAREEGGYLVRSWTKIHETAEQRGRRLKADRERKKSERNPTLFPDGIQSDSTWNDDRNPPDSLSDTEHSSTEQDRNTAVVSNQGEHRHETLPASDATKPPPATDPADARCTAHRGVPTPPPCLGCKAARENAQTAVDRDRDQAEREHRAATEAAARNCTACDGTWVVNPDTTLPTRTRCDHRRTA